MIYFTMIQIEKETQINHVKQRAYEYGVEWFSDVVIQQPGGKIEIIFYNYEELQSIESPRVAAKVLCSTEKEDIVHVELKQYK